MCPDGLWDKRFARCWPAADTPNTSPFPPVRCCRFRDGVDLVDAAGLPEVACTVWSNLVMTAHLGEGQLLLMHGGASGIGTHAIQVARALGARVAVTAGSAEKLDALSRAGRRRSPSTIATRTSSRGCARRPTARDVIFDIMGASYLDRNIDALAADGQLVIIGMQGGVKGELNIGKLLGKRARVIGTTLRGAAGERPEQQGRDRAKR